MYFDKKQQQYCMHCAYAKELLKKIVEGRESNNEFLSGYLMENLVSCDVKKMDLKEAKARHERKYGTAESFDEQAEKDKLVKEKIVDNFLYGRKLDGNKIVYDSDTELCMRMIHQFYQAVRCIVEKNIWVATTDTQTALRYMLQENAYYGEINQDYRKYNEDKEKYEKNIDRLETSRKNIDRPDTSQKNVIGSGNNHKSEKSKESDKGNEIAEKLHDLLEDFYNIEYTDEYIRYLNSKDITPILERGDCLVPVLTDLLNRKNSCYEQFKDRLMKLSEEKRTLMYSFMDRAPKKFGYTLALVMEEKEMSEQDLFTILQECDICKNKWLRVSNIQSFLKCTFPAQNQDLIPYIARALLVDEEVLYTGYGNSYGTWKGYLSSDFLDSYKALPEMTEYIESLSNNRHLDATRTLMRKEIANLISSEEVLKDYLNEVRGKGDLHLPDLHETIETNFYCENREMQFAALLEPDSLYALLEVLEQSNV